MHEMSVAQNIIDIVLQHIPGQNSHSVQRVTVKIGKMAGIVPDSLEFGFEALASDTPMMEKAKLNMEFTPLVIHCGKCNKEFELNDPFFICPECNNTKVGILSGTELQVTEIEIDDPPQEES